jgi:isopentenyl-diphosphate Delta-isomerase
MDEMEIIDVVDERGQIIDTMTRQQTEKLNHLIQNVLVFIFNPRGEVWIQKRAIHKKHFPGLWDISACGAVASGEGADKAAQRETVEETGIEIPLSHVESFLNVFPGHKDQIFRRLSHLYIGISEDKPK